MDKDKNEVLLEELPVILEELFKIIYKIIYDTDDVEEIIKNEAVKDVDLTELIQITDQQIAEYINEKICDKEKKDLVFKVFQKLKINQSIEEITDEVENEEKEQRKRAVLALFDKIIEPDEIEIMDKDVCIKYNFGENSKLKNKIDEIDKWNRDNVVETVSRELKVPIDNIILVDNVSSYIDFISNFDENNYVSRGQKDCKFKLEPSLHRIYNDSFQLHSSQYESAFKQRILYYDETTEKKNAEELRAYGQHYGLPTNYLDFTEAHLISLLFAVEDFEYIDNHSIVYFVDALSYNRDNVKAERKLVDFSDDEMKASLEREYSDKSYFIRVGNCNERIHFQKGCFLRVEHRDTLDRMFEKYTKIAIIDKDCKENILKELFKLGITFENIYPDKDNMVRTIKFIKEHM